MYKETVFVINVSAVQCVEAIVCTCCNTMHGLEEQNSPTFSFQVGGVQQILLTSLNFCIKICKQKMAVL